MAHRTYTKVVKLSNGNEFTVSAKMSKANSENLFGWLWMAFDLEDSKKELTGIIGDENERATIYQTPFSKNEIKDPEQYLTDLMSYAKSISSELITIDNYEKFVAMKNKIVDKHIPISDERITKEENDRKNAEWKIAQENQEQEAKERTAKEAIEKVELRKIYPYLIEYDNNAKISNQAHVAKNIRIELKRLYPGQKFSVTSDSFSMGDSVDVSWDDGPTDKEIGNMISKYQNSSFDGMTDYSSHVNSVFMNLYGGSKYVHSSRSISKEAVIKACEAEKIEPIFDKFDNLKLDYHDNMSVNDWLNKHSFYVKQEAPKKQESNSGSGITVSHNEEKNGVEISFPDKPSEEVRTKLKDNKFRWSRFSKVWYKRYSEESWTFANSLIGA